MTLLGEVLLALLALLVLSHINITLKLRGIETRERESQERMAKRATLLEERAALIAHELAEEKAQRKLRHDAMIEASLAAAEAAREAKAIASDTNTAVHKLSDDKTAELVDLSKDTNDVVHELKDKP